MLDKRKTDNHKRVEEVRKEMVVHGCTAGYKPHLDKILRLSDLPAYEDLHVIASDDFALPGSTHEPDFSDIHTTATPEEAFATTGDVAGCTRCPWDDVEEPPRDFQFELGSQYGAYTQSQDFPTQDYPSQDPPSPTFFSPVPPQQDLSYGPNSYVADTPDFTFGPGADQGGSQERLFGEIQEEEAPQPSRPSQHYMPRFEEIHEELQEEGRGKRLKRKKVRYTPSDY